MTPPRRQSRGPERSWVMLRLLRRLAALSLVLAAAVLALPHLVEHFGLAGPTAEERLGSARQTLAVARGYGATAEMPALAAAERAMAAAEALHGEGRGREARRAAREAQRLASEAQRQALVRRDAQRLRARKVVDELDRRIDDLEQLYGARKDGLPRRRAAELFSRMKRARAAAAVLVLAWDRQDYGEVIEGEAVTMALLDEVRQELQSR